MFATEGAAPARARPRPRLRPPGSRAPGTGAPGSGTPGTPGTPGTLGALAERVRPTAASRTRLLPVPAPLIPLLPDGGLRRGTVVQCAGDGALSLVLAMIGDASAAGSWCGLVGVDDLGVLAAAGHGVDLRRLAVVRAATAQWASAAGKLLEGLDLVVVEPPARGRPPAARTLAARARRHGAVLLVLGPPASWPVPADVRLRVVGSRWHGLDRGAGHLRGRRVVVEAGGRGMASRPVRQELWLPTAAGGVAVAGGEPDPPAGRFRGNVPDGTGGAGDPDAPGDAAGVGGPAGAGAG